RQRGKGYALDFGLRHLSADAPDVLIMVDADCQVQPGAIDAIANLALTTQRPVQATYLLAPSPEPSPKEMVSTFAFKVKNLVRPLGLRVLGQPCLLTGTGMAFPWASLKDVDLASGNIVEDMKLGLDLAIAGHPPIMCPDALVMGEQPQQSATAMTQRTRWEHGHLQTLLTCVPPLLWQGIRQGRLGLMALALDLCVPPLSLLVMLWLAGATVLTATTLLLGTPWLAAIVVYGTGLGLFIAIGLAWAGFARQDIPVGKLLSIPLYILWKIPLYFKFLSGPEAKWIRTERDG
ncbi:MAG: glycosyltransferase, partial [Cyanobacteria bacterium P01_D01_bin.2]